MTNHELLLAVDEQDGRHVGRLRIFAQLVETIQGRAAQFRSAKDNALGRRSSSALKRERARSGSRCKPARDSRVSSACPESSFEIPSCSLRA